MEWHFKVVKILKYIFYFTYIIIFLNLISTDKGTIYLNILDNIIKAFIGTLIVYYYNPYAKLKANVPRIILFEAGILLILSSSLNTILKSLPIIKYFYQI